MTIASPETLDLNDPGDAWAFKVAMAAYSLAQPNQYVQAAGQDILSQTGERRGQWGQHESALLDGVAGTDQKQSVNGFWQPTAEGACALLTAGVGWGLVQEPERSANRHYFANWINGPNVSCYPHTPHGALVPATHVLVLAGPTAAATPTGGGAALVVFALLGLGGAAWYARRKGML